MPLGSQFPNAIAWRATAYDLVANDQGTVTDVGIDGSGAILNGPTALAPALTGYPAVAWTSRDRGWLRVDACS